ncbi:Uncharacterised protein [Klebsiella pneumoniae]|nr:Uncharacterised protein [Klebsiella pneumoniae]SME60189.1 Uncharacterised protein [Klebsiella pneumoniae]
MKISQSKLRNALNESQVCAEAVNRNDAVNITSFILNRCQHRHSAKFHILRFSDYCGDFLINGGLHLSFYIFIFHFYPFIAVCVGNTNHLLRLRARTFVGHGVAERSDYV